MKIVIIGGGVAGTQAAISIRKQDKKAEILIIDKQKLLLQKRIAIILVIAQSKYSYKLNRSSLLEPGDKIS